jgi:nitrous oxidase accessory protein NosD
MRALFFALAALAPATPALATVINVSPGPGTPLQDAIDAASPGDTLRIAGGGYPEAIVINKPLRLFGPPNTYLDAAPQPATIDAGCAPATTGITVAANDVAIRDLRVITFTDYGIDVQGRNAVKIRNVLLLPNCGTPPLATINVAASTRVTLDGDWAVGFSVAGPPAIRLSSLAAGAKVRVQRTIAGDHTVGIAIDDCAPRSVLVSRSYANFNLDTGIRLQNSDGIVIKRTQVQSNPTNGIVIDAASDDNLLVGNNVNGSTTDVSDAGTGNCWKKNSFTTGTVPSCP